jgi:hypothetical protein
MRSHRGQQPPMSLPSLPSDHSQASLNLLVSSFPVPPRPCARRVFIKNLSKVALLSVPLGGGLGFRKFLQEPETCRLPEGPNRLKATQASAPAEARPWCFSAKTEEHELALQAHVCSFNNAYGTPLGPSRVGDKEQRKSRAVCT